MKFRTSFERRASVRKPATECPWLMASRVRPGRDVTVLNLSGGGALVEGGRMLPGARMDLHLLMHDHGYTISGRVLRSTVCAVDGERGVRYRTALCFDTTFADAEWSPQMGGCARRVAVSRRPSCTGDHRE